MNVVSLEVLFRALADRTRLRLLNLMADSEVCVCFLVQALGISQPKISRHLAYLRKAGIVTARRDGKWMHYRLAKLSDSHALKILEAVNAKMETDQKMQLDKRRLVRLCCSSTLPAALKQAPKPSSALETHTG